MVGLGCVRCVSRVLARKSPAGRAGLKRRRGGWVDLWCAAAAPRLGLAEFFDAQVFPADFVARGLVADSVDLEGDDAGGRCGVF